VSLIGSDTSLGSIILLEEDCTSLVDYTLKLGPNSSNTKAPISLLLLVSSLLSNRGSRSLKATSISSKLGISKLEVEKSLRESSFCNKLVNLGIFKEGLKS